MTRMSVRQRTYAPRLNLLHSPVHLPPSAICMHFDVRVMHRASHTLAVLRWVRMLGKCK